MGVTTNQLAKADVINNRHNFGLLNSPTDSTGNIDFRLIYPYFQERLSWYKIKHIFNHLFYSSVWEGTPPTLNEWRSRKISLEIFEPLLQTGSGCLPGFSSVVIQLKREKLRYVDRFQAVHLLNLAINECADRLDGLPLDKQMRKYECSDLTEWKDRFSFKRQPAIDSLILEAKRKPPSISGILLQGSYADGMVVEGFSDCDLVCFVTVPRNADEGHLLNIGEWIFTLNHYLLAINPCMHHGPMIVLDRELKWTTEASLPSVFLDKGVWLSGKTQTVMYHDGDLESILVISIFEDFFERTITKVSDISNGFQALWWASNTLILPLLLHQLKEGSSIWKRDCFSARNGYLDYEHWGLIDQVSKIRMRLGEWIDKRLPDTIWEFTSNLNPGVCLSHYKNILHLDQQSLEKIGLDEKVILRARLLWEFVARFAVSFHEKQIVEQKPKLVSKSVAAPERFYRPTKDLENDDYELAKREFLSRCSKISCVHSVFEFGEVSCPGLSDIDLCVILEPTYQGIPKELLTESFDADHKYIFDHDPLFLGEDNSEIFGAVFPIFRQQQLLGMSSRLPTITEFPPSIQRALITAHTITKYPDDILRLSIEPTIRWRTILAYLHSFVHIKTCFEIVGIPTSAEIDNAVALDQIIRDDFRKTGICKSNKLQEALTTTLIASCATLESLANFWLDYVPDLKQVLPAANFQKYRQDVLRAVDKQPFENPYKPEVLTILQIHLSTAILPDAPSSNQYSKFHHVLKDYLRIKRSFAGKEKLNGRSVSVYIDDPRVQEQLLYAEHQTVSLANHNEVKCPAFFYFMFRSNCFSLEHNLPIYLNCSKIWEYPWLWFNGLSQINWNEQRVVDLGSELSPMPWFLATLGAEVTLIETDPQWIPLWEELRTKLDVNVNWHIVATEILPLQDQSIDLVTSFSVIEHQPDKQRAVDEIVRILKPGGILAISFDICEPDMGMTFPEGNGCALTLSEFEDLFWFHPCFGNEHPPSWNLEDVPEFIEWHLQSTPHHNYTVGGAILKKTSSPKASPHFYFGSGWYAEEREAVDRWRWSNKQGEIHIYCDENVPVELQCELFSVPPNNKISIVLDGTEVFVHNVDWQGFQPATPVKFDLTNSKHFLEFKSSEDGIVLATDPRSLAFAVKNLTFKRAT